MTTLDRETMENILEGVGSKLKYFGTTNIDFPYLSSIMEMPQKDGAAQQVLLRSDLDYIAKTSAFFLYMMPYNLDTIPFLLKMRNKILYNALSIIIPPGKDSHILTEIDEAITATHKRFISADQKSFQFSLEVTIGKFYSADIMGRMRAQ